MSYGATWFPRDPEDVSIATTPVDLADAVRNELNDHGNGASFTVEVSEVKGAFPFIVEASLTRGDRGDGTSSEPVGTRQRGQWRQ